MTYNVTVRSTVVHYLLFFIEPCTPRDRLGLAWNRRQTIPTNVEIRQGLWASTRFIHLWPNELLCVNWHATADPNITIRAEKNGPMNVEGSPWLPAPTGLVSAFLLYVAKLDRPL